MSINPLDLFFSRLSERFRDVKTRYSESEQVAEITRFLSDRSITTITAQELYDKLHDTPDAISSDYTNILQELIKDNLEELDTAITAVQVGTDKIITSAATETKQDSLETKIDSLIVAIGSPVQATAWKIANAVYLQNFAVGVRQPSVNGLFFNANGTKMYTCGNTDDELNEYDLGTAWNISTAVWLQLKTVAGQTLDPIGLFISSDGAKCYIADKTNHAILEYDLGTPWDISTLAYVDNIAVGANNPTGVFFRSDGIKMYVASETGQSVREFDLSVAWDITSAILANSCALGAWATPQGVFFRPDGSKMYVISATTDNIDEFDLSTPWDTTTIIHVSSFSVAGQETAPTDIFWKSDGTKVYICGLTGDDINEYDV